MGNAIIFPGVSEWNKKCRKLGLRLVTIYFLFLVFFRRKKQGVWLVNIFSIFLVEWKKRKKKKNQEVMLLKDLGSWIGLKLNYPIIVHTNTGRIC